jgi:autotransporter-associated beta strand protein
VVFANAAPTGGGLFVADSAVVRLGAGTRIVSNSASYYGGGVVLDQGKADVVMQAVGWRLELRASSFLPHTHALFPRSTVRHPRRVSHAWFQVVSLPTAR